MLFATSFKLYFGVSDEMLDSLEDLCRVMAPHTAIDSMNQGMWKLTRDAQERFGLQKHFFCVSCDKRLPNSKALCCTEGCELQGKFSQSEMSGVNGGDPNLDYSPSKTGEYTLAGNNEKDDYEKEDSFVTAHQNAPKMHARMSSVEAFKEAIDDGAISLEQLGEAVPNFDLGVSYDNFITGTMKNCKMNMTKAKVLQKQSSNVKESSDSIIRSLTAVVQQQAKAIFGMSAAVSISSKLKPVYL
ncbi:unnamed protein product [Heligmosomoides polygyrus]|uniref:Gnk2-homologous domain-containing protein n=1 Tax=Heligmosomoides polygyrus TaxID=6339 RepID=A0A183F3D7_HELPZ|nr:unnamed protein product [Heligmosomoides polygyrus]